MTEYEKMMSLLETSWFMKSQIVPCLVGPPGIGKTAAVMEHAAKHNAKVVKIVASRCVPSETVGMTMPDNENRSMEIYNSMQLSSLGEGDILFLDELLEADQFVLSTLLTVIESREMADGTPLPDIQIIAATNDTIPASQLRDNIKQRFMFQRFEMDKDQTCEYIKEKTGIAVPSSVKYLLETTGNGYNFLSPRSLTKLCMWISAVPEDQLNETANAIDRIWSSSIGTQLAKARRDRDKDPNAQVRKAVKDLLGEREIDAGIDFDSCSLEEMLDILQSLPDWNSISNALASMEIDEHDDSDDEVSF